MRTGGEKGIRKRSRIGSTALLAGVVVWVAGCMTLQMNSDRLWPRRPAFQFKVVSDQMPLPRIAWRDLPRLAETLLTLAPDLPACEQVHFYADDESGHIRRIEGKPFPTPAATRVDRDGIPSGSNGLRDDPCGIWISGAVRPHGVEQICTLTFATGEGPFRSMDLRVAGSPGEPPLDAGELILGMFFFIPFDIAVTPFITPLYFYERHRSRIPGEDGPVTVRFSFPDGLAREVTVAKTDFSRIRALDPFGYGRAFGWRGDPLPPRCEGARCWIRAAILELGVDYREEVFMPGAARGATMLSMLDGREGSWTYRLHGTRDVHSTLDEELGSAHTIDLWMNP